MQDISQISVTEIPAWIEQRTDSYKGRKSKFAPGREQIRRVIEAYAYAAANGEKLSYVTLGEAGGVGFNTAARILQRIGVKPFFKPRAFRQRSGVSVEQLIHAYEEGLGATDIAHFCELEKSTVRKRLLGAGIVLEPRYLFCWKGLKSTMRVCYSLESQAYERRDMGVGIEKVAAALAVPADLIEYIDLRRETDEPVIVAGLRALFPYHADTPYRTLPVEKAA